MPFREGKATLIIITIMRKILFFCLVLMSTFSYAQTLNIHFKNGTTVEFNKELVDHVDFSEKPAPPTLTAGESVDLGLSVKWASCNLGATKPEDCGDYYAWGETTPKDNYWISNYAYYNNKTKDYTDIGNNIAGTSYDAATVNLGKGWRMPTKSEIEELVSRCTWKWEQINGINGFLVSGNGNMIFIPALKSDVGLNFSNAVVLLWSSTEALNSYSHYLEGDPDRIDMHFYQKYYGLPIRPVISYDDADGTNYDDTSVTSMVSSYYAGGSVMSNGNTILSGSKLNFYFKNGSTEAVTLTGIQLINGSTNAAGSNLLSSDVNVAAGESTGYTITVGASGIENPICRFTYRYNKHTYTTEAKYQSFNFAKGKTTQLMAE